MKRKIIDSSVDDKKINAINTDDSIEDIEQIENLIVKKNNKIKIFSVFFVILILVIVFSIIGIRSNNNKYIDEVARINTNDYILIKDDEKFGYIDVNGKVIIKPKFDSAEKFINGYAKVKEGDTYKLIDKSGKVKFEVKEKNDIVYIDEYNIWIINKNLYNDKLKKLNKKNTVVRYYSNGYLRWINESDKTAGLMDYNGKITYKHKLESEKDHFNILAIGAQNNKKDSNKYCTVNYNNNKYAIINCATGKVIYDYTENYISNEHSTYFDIKKSDNYSFVERLIIINDEIAYKSDDKDVVIYNYDDYYTITNTPDRKFLYLSKKDGKITEKQPDIEEIKVEKTTSEKLLDVKINKCDSGVGLKSDSGRKLSCEWDDIKLFDEIVTNYLISKNKYYVLVQKDEKTYIMNLSNKKKIAEFNSTNVILNNGSLFAEFVDKDNGEKIVYSLSTGKSNKFDKDSNISLYSNYFTVKKNGNLEYYNLKLKKIYSSENK